MNLLSFQNRIKILSNERISTQFRKSVINHLFSVLMKIAKTHHEHSFKKRKCSLICVLFEYLTVEHY